FVGESILAKRGLRSFIFDLTIGLSLFLFWNWKDQIKEQEKADRTQLVVPNIFFFMLSIRLIRFFSCLIFLLAGIGTKSTYLNLLAIIIFFNSYLRGIHTYPMVGPIFKERLKNAFMFKKPALSEN